MEHQVTAAVSAPTEIVYQLFTDVESWPGLTPSITEVRRLDSGPLRVGSEAVIRQPGLRPATWQVTSLDPGRGFTWQTTVAGVTAVGGHLVTQDGDRAVITLSLRQHGPLAGLVGALTGRMVRRNLARELEGFRTQAERAAARQD